MESEPKVVSGGQEDLACALATPPTSHTLDWYL